MNLVISSKHKRTDELEIFSIKYTCGACVDTFVLRAQKCQVMRLHINSRAVGCQEALSCIDKLEFDPRFSGRMNRIKRILSES
jgi:hypothetical protein